MPGEPEKPASSSADRSCPVCHEAIPAGGGVGSGRLSDGIYCSLTCFVLKNDCYIPSLAELDKNGRAK
jgi:hypothetical protein